jgi:hypothetical protein
MMYCALLALAILWDDYSLLDRASLARKVGSCQGKDRGCALFIIIVFVLCLLILERAPSRRLFV